jgi:hypothetical protein
MEVENDLPGSERARFLVFDHADIARRVDRYPRHWETLDDQSVLAIMG